jgi:ABC-2 type transport system ATP-binding protein
LYHTRNFLRGDDILIEATDIEKSYGKQKVLSGVSFTLEEGHVMGILGPNGAGKTTLIKILALLARPDGGTLRIGGYDALRDIKLIRPYIGYVPQDVALFEDLTVRDNLLCWSGQSGAGARVQAERLIEELSLSSFASKKVSALSGGMKRRVNLAVAMLDGPKVLILDEPLVGVDIEQRQLINQCLKKLAQSGVSMIIASHHAEEMMALADEFMVMKDGEILFLGSAAQLLELKNRHGGATLEEVLLKMLKLKYECEGAQIQ